MLTSLLALYREWSIKRTFAKEVQAVLDEESRDDREEANAIHEEVLRRLDPNDPPEWLLKYRRD
ncbi:hypothetical protein GTQ45_01965 [Pyruvatibacter mobilis]|uniref:Uncharacterized protein n=1 Tax=Pyruvatibacter mobilis TaxID=1712261 RepID=A0A845Q7U6_9HYPH|nr:hypothetical protein [Pyruvatibacter mobilis]NBG94497.1 hypothetical protein [Pyruvatibacter mobilis]QJD74017.1 hypothetical protein HG718_00515 [Pyruvatibacter mobilis]